MGKLIGIVGSKGSGKDTMADYLCDTYNGTKDSFAKSLKDTLKIVFNLSDEQLYGNLKETIDDRYGVSPRVLMQYVGTEMFRNMLGDISPKIGDNIWVMSLENRFIEWNKLDINKDKYYFIADVRMQNEIDMILKHNGIVVHVKRTNQKYTNDEMNVSIKNHKSEQHDLLSGIHSIIENNNTLDDYFQKIEKWFQTINNH